MSDKREPQKPFGALGTNIRGPFSSLPNPKGEGWEAAYKEAMKANDLAVRLDEANKELAELSLSLIQREELIEKLTEALLTMKTALECAKKIDLMHLEEAGVTDELESDDFAFYDEAFGAADAALELAKKA